MNELDALDLASLAARALGEPRCRRYLFDRPDSQDAPVDAASSRPAPNPLLPGWEDALEHRR
ncbi:hypothetical protein LJR225_001647 [Phenylobacterium sp. LjRoot225]|uniref:hypothetical protein n=1 Tax=Phenylobacterium sp. LjRoot225 TaxID=3342285 RepID=UPI003ECF9EBB